MFSFVQITLFRLSTGVKFQFVWNEISNYYWTKVVIFIFRYPDGVHMQDLESALHYTLRNEVPRVSSIEGDKFVALKELLNVLAKVIAYNDLLWILSLHSVNHCQMKMALQHLNYAGLTKDQFLDLKKFMILCAKIVLTITSFISWFQNFPGSLVVTQYLGKLRNWLMEQKEPLSSDQWLQAVNSMQVCTCTLYLG